MRGAAAAALCGCGCAPAAATAAPVGTVVVSYPPQGSSALQLFTVKEDGSSAQQITSCEHGCMQPSWSPDGTSIVYVQQSQQGLNLWLVAPDGSGARALTTPPASGARATYDHILPSWVNGSTRIVWSRQRAATSQPAKYPRCGPNDFDQGSELWTLDTRTGATQPLFPPGSAQAGYSNMMPAPSPNGTHVAFVSNRTGQYRLWVAPVDGSDGRLASPGPTQVDLQNDGCMTNIEQKVPVWSPDGRSIAHWEGCEMTYMSRWTGIQDHARDQLISNTFHVQVIDVSGGGAAKQSVGKGDDPAWSPDNRVSRAYPEPAWGGPYVMVQSRGGGWEQLPIVPRGTPSWGRYSWAPAGL